MGGRGNGERKVSQDGFKKAYRVGFCWFRDVWCCFVDRIWRYAQRRSTKYAVYRLASALRTGTVRAFATFPFGVLFSVREVIEFSQHANA